MAEARIDGFRFAPLNAAMGAAIVHELTKAIDVRIICFFNFLGLAAILVWIGMFDNFAYFDDIKIPMFVWGFSLALFFAPLAALAVTGFSGESFVRAAEELAMPRAVFGAFGIASQGVTVLRRTPFHQLDRADHFGGRRFASLDLLSVFYDKLRTMVMSASAARGQAAQLIRQQAQLLALNDAFIFGAGRFHRACRRRPARALKLYVIKTLEEPGAEELMEQP
ncbi:MAG: hypothetical protein N2444_06675 [Methylocystis sp.]|nr:hypothetical protein [Methylocystis sp.]